MAGEELFCYVKCTNDLFCNLYLKSQEALGIEGNGKSYCGEQCIWSEGYRERKAVFSTGIWPRCWIICLHQLGCMHLRGVTVVYIHPFFIWGTGTILISFLLLLLLLVDLLATEYGTRKLTTHSIPHP